MEKAPVPKNKSNKIDLAAFAFKAEAQSYDPDALPTAPTGQGLRILQMISQPPRNYIPNEKEDQKQDEDEEPPIYIGTPSKKKVGITVGGDKLIEVDKIDLPQQIKLSEHDRDWILNNSFIKNLQFKVKAIEIETSRTEVPRAIQLHIVNNLRVEKENSFIYSKRAKTTNQSIELFKTTKLNGFYYYVMPRCFSSTFTNIKFQTQNTYELAKDEAPSKNVDFPLFEHQKLALQSGHDLINKGSKSFIFQMPPGGGKTLVAQLFCNQILIKDNKPNSQPRKPKILVVVDTKILFIQWIQEIEKLGLFYNESEDLTTNDTDSDSSSDSENDDEFRDALNEDDWDETDKNDKKKEKDKECLPPRPKANYKISFKKVTSNISVTIIKTMLLDKYKHLYQDFDICVIDECHILGAMLFCEIMKRALSYKMVIGLSATPSRPDKMEKLYYNYFEYIIKCNVSNIEAIQLDFYFFRDYSDPVFANKLGYRDYKDKTRIIRAINTLCKNQLRNDFIVQMIIQLLQDPKNNILVVCPRIFQIKYIMTELEKHFGQQEFSQIIGGRGIKFQESFRVLIFTQQMAGKGFNWPKSNYLVSTYPVTGSHQGLFQLCGRITRGYNCKVPKIIQLADYCLECKYTTLEQYYKDLYSQLLKVRYNSYEVGFDNKPPSLKKAITRRQYQELFI